ncbi:hypothetical protein FLACOL_00539 [Flavobacterium columnare]|uniref:Uncharacterized protein n=1 Tax=Flavobacterium columnare TaxID=996 RepID=A0A2N9P885_9FLAO|nr:hypothetical protein FLACOL_00539 [Flavobacterium columnare]
MKNIYKPILYSLLILVVSTIEITYWYISDHLEYNPIEYKFYKVSDIQIQSLIDVILQIGFVGGILPMFLFLIIYFLKIKIKKTWLFFFLIFILIAFFPILTYKFILYTIFHDFKNPITFK